MDWQKYQREMHQHPRYKRQLDAARQAHEEGERARREAVPWYQRRAMWLGLANAMPLLGVLFLDWSAVAILWAYWGEAVGLTMFGWKPLWKPEGAPYGWLPKQAIQTMFLFGQFQFLLFFSSAEVGSLFARQLSTYTDFFLIALAGALLLFPSHLYPRRTRAPSAMGHIVVLHISIVLGGFFVMTGGFAGLAIVFIVIKTVSQLTLATSTEQKLGIRAAPATRGNR